MSPKYFSGWRAGLARCTAVAGIVTAINITFLIVAIPRLETSSPGSREGALFSGDCKRAKRYNIWLHLIINLLASALLAAGNYTQQVLTAPTRNEIDIAHSERKWLDIGVSSLHNLRHISGKRVTAWILLALTSVPIHLLYVDFSRSPSTSVTDCQQATIQRYRSRPASTAIQYTLLHGMISMIVIMCFLMHGTKLSGIPLTSSKDWRTMSA